MTRHAARLVLLGVFLYAARFAAQVTRDASVEVRIVDAGTGRGTPVRVLLSDSHGVRPKVRGALAVSESAIGIPKAALAVMYGRDDNAGGYLLQPDGSFYVDGGFEATLPPGRYSLTLSKGPEYASQTQVLDLAPGRHAAATYRMNRWIDMPARGWYSADDHIHLRRSPGDNANILRWLEAEDVHVGHLLQMGDFWQTYYPQYAFGPDGLYREQDFTISSGQEEPRTPEIGHTISLGATSLVRFRNDYYSFDRLFDRVHELGGITGFAHQGVSFFGYRGMSLMVPRGKIDFLELAQFCVDEGPLATEHYYRFLDLGFKLTALAGSDFPWCGLDRRWGRAEQLSQIGNARFYAYTGTPFSFERWFESVKAGHTFVTTGPMLELTVDGKLPGDTVDVTPGARVHVSAKASADPSGAPLGELEIVAHQEVVRNVAAADAGQTGASLHLDLDLPVERGLWLAARIRGSATQAAHTTPVYITVNHGGFANPRTAQAYLERSRKDLVELEEELRRPGTALDSQASRHRQNLERQITAARERLAELETQTRR
jgi:hypothetical protein